MMKIVLLILVQACDSSSQCPSDAPEPACIDRCASNCVSGDGKCDDNTQCGSGLECPQVDHQSSCFGEEDQASQCRPGGFNRLALQRGFGVGGMQISVDQTDSTPEVTWQAPPGASVVACALFSCNPSFTRVACFPTEEHELKDIVNFDRCVLLFGASPASQLTFPLIEDNKYPREVECGDSQGEQRVIIKLAVGCWAYDNTSMIAASELIHVAGRLLPDLSMISHDSACLADGDDCYDQVADRFGVCFDGSCRARCRTSVDCALAVGSPKTGSQCEWSCRDVPRNAMGACLRN